MNKADKKQLKKDPRYAAVRDAHHRLCVAYAEAQRIQLEATAAFKQETGIERTLVPAQEPLPDERLFELLRPRGDKVRICRRLDLDIVVELESVTEKRIRAGGAEYDLEMGARRGGYERMYVHREDLAKIKAGELKGWRQKPWGK